MNNQILYGRRRGPVVLPAAPPPRDRCSKLETYRPLVLAPATWPTVLRDETPLGSILDRGRG
jgi:hypothetical protein